MIALPNDLKAEGFKRFLQLSVLARLWETLSHDHFSHKGLSDIIKLENLSAKGLDVKFYCRFHICKGFLITISFTYDRALDADGVSDIAIVMFLYNYFYLLHYVNLSEFLENKSMQKGTR